MTEFAEIRAGWEQAANDDPMFHILTHMDKIGNQLDPEEFFATGRGEIDGVMERLDELRPDRQSHEALDFGCGVGRLTQALRVHYDLALGVDISPRMVELAREYASACGCSDCSFLASRRPDLAYLEDGRFDLIYSMITLQHIPVSYQERYIKEFMRVLAPGGLAVFQTPEGDGRLSDNGHLSMHGVKPAAIETWVGAKGGSVIARDPNLQGEFPGWLYVVER